MYISLQQTNKKQFIDSLCHVFWHGTSLASLLSLKGYEQFGNDWEKIITWGKLERSVDQVKRRFSRIKARHHQPGGEKRSDEEFFGPNIQPIVSSTSTRPEEEEPPRKMVKTSHNSPHTQVNEVQPHLLLFVWALKLTHVPLPNVKSLPTETAEQLKKTLEEVKAQQEQLKAEEKRLGQLQNHLKDWEQNLQKREQKQSLSEETLQAKVRSIKMLCRKTRPTSFTVDAKHFAIAPN